MESRPTKRTSPKRRKTGRQGASGHGSSGAKTAHYWSDRVTKESSALDLDSGIFTWNDPKRIAASLKRSAIGSRRRKAEPFRSALSMLVFYINRAGKNLPSSRRRTLEQAKVELRRQFGRE